MTDWDAISAELSKPLDPRHVKPPPRGKYGDYIEGWHAIAEANRIFGHGGWSYTVQTLQMTNADAEERNGKTQHKVGYLAVVSVTVGDATRTDVGHGQGHMPTAGDAHDSAMKEAVTDALKRALRSFGWCFGLALYDKSKEHVQAPPPPPPPPPSDEQMQKAKAAANAIVDQIQAAGSLAELDAIETAKAALLRRLADGYPEIHRGVMTALGAKRAVYADMQETFV